MTMPTFVLIIWMANGYVDFSGKFSSEAECVDWGEWKIKSLNKWPDLKVIGWKCVEQDI
jgi:hypothetical protein